ncbi:unnamed protein product [Calypogeia fissa]
MAGVVNLHCIQPLPAFPTPISIPTRTKLTQYGTRHTIAALPLQIQVFHRFSTPPLPSPLLSGGGRRTTSVAQFRHLIPSPCFGRMRQPKPKNFAALRVFAAAKGNLRQKQKPKSSAPSLTDQNNGAGIRPPSAPSLTDLSSQEEETEVSAPPLVDVTLRSVDQGRDVSKEWNGSVSGGNVGVLSSSWSSFPRIIWRGTLRRLSSLRLAIAELFVIAGLSALGTIIEQNESPQFYFDSYPEENPMFGFLTWRVILGGSLDHIYTSWYYLGLLLLLAASLMACSTTRQFPIVKVAKRWSFLKTSAAFDQLPISETLEKARLGDFATLLMAEGFEVFVKGPTLYAFKGLAGRYAPIGVHIALLLIMAGATISAIGGYHGTVMIPQGLGFQVGDVVAPKGILSLPSPVMNVQVQINKFFIDYLDTGVVAQFHSDISILDRKDREIFRKVISVNDPLRYAGLTMYQTDWAIAAVQMRVDGSEPYNLVMAALEKGDKKLFGTFLPLGSDGLEKARGISILARDLQSVVIYDQEGKFVGVRRPGSGKPIDVDGVSIVVDDLIGSSGLELKMDPGVPIVYAGFGALMLTTCISYLSHSQVWALQNGTSLLVGGKSNRGKADFETQLNTILDLVPEVKIVSAAGPEQPLENESSNGGVPISAVEVENPRVKEVQSR